MIRLATVSPCYNEEEVLRHSVERMTALFERMMAEGLISNDSMMVFVNDGSRDRTWQMIEELHRENKYVRGINLSRNVGHQNAIFAGMMTARNDAYRKITFSEDNFQFNSTIGFKAVKKWYYSASLQFKTQFFTNYKENTMDMKAAFLSPAELNLGLGMTFTHENKEKDQKFTLAINPLSYNMKYCRNISDISPTEFGIKDGHHSKHDFGSSINGNLKWKFNAYITWSAQLDFFTNYKYVQANWQNTFDFYVTRHLSTQIYTHLRFDRNHPRDDKWRYFQFRESLSFGLTYRFATI